MRDLSPDHASASLDDVYADGYRGQVDRLIEAPSGLMVARFATFADREELVAFNPAASFAVAITQRAHRVAVTANGRLIRSGLSPVGSVVFTDPGARCDTVIEGEVEVLFILLPIQLVMAVCDHGGIPLRTDAGLSFANPGDKIDTRLMALATEAHREAMNPGPFSSLRADLIGQEIIIQLLLHHSSVASGRATDAVVARGGLAGWQLRRACEMMDACLEEELTLPMLAAAVQCSPTHFSRAFKQSTGMPPFAWLLHRRIDRAKDLLKACVLPIAEVALAVGFSAQPQFTTAFRRVTGTTPAAWRKAALH